MEQMNHRIEDTISRRAGVGPSDMVKGWQSMLTTLLSRMEPYLQNGMVVTFQHLTPDEKTLFERITGVLDVPEPVRGLYLPPSVRNQMLYTNRGASIPEEAAHPADDGVLLFSLPSSDATIVNALLAHSPHTPAIDVYQEGAMIAGYMFDAVDDMLAALNGVIRTFLVSPPAPSSPLGK